MAGAEEAQSSQTPRASSQGRGRGGKGRGRGGQQRGSNNARRGGGGGGGGRGSGNRNPEPVNDGELAEPAARDVAAAAIKARMLAAGAAAKDDDAQTDDGNTCFICANPVAHQSIAPCNHSTCHICGLRMRALYKTKDCAHCRTPAPFVIFTDDFEKKFEDFSERDITTTDDNIGIKYTHEDIVGDTILLIRYNCPEPDCDFAGLGWPDLHRHVRSAHKKRMCDLCTRNKRVFTHEHELFSDKELDRHMKHGDDKPGTADQTGFKGHPLCGFCGQRFYDDDKLYEHCRHKHERCFICDRRDSRKPHYYLDYNSLEKHFKTDHYICNEAECLEKKFVVFESEMDLQAHRLEEHSGGKSSGREGRLVNMSGFDIRETYQPERRGGRGGRDGDNRGGRVGRRGRDQNAEPPVATPNQPLRRDEIAFQRQMQIHSAQSVSTRTFGGSLTAPTPAAASGRNSGATTPRANGTPVDQSLERLSVNDTANMSNDERARLLRHNAVIERASNMLGNDSRKMAAFRDNISTYRNNALTAPQLIDAFFALFSDTASNALGTLVREVSDLFEDKAKSDALRKAWQDWRAINEDYPSLPGLSGMHGATTGSSGWASAAAGNAALPRAAPTQQHSNRVLRLKNSTRLGPAPVSNKSVPGWTPAASSSSSSSSRAPPSSASAFPSLSSASGSSSRPPAATASRPSWTGSVSQNQASAASSSRSRGFQNSGGGDNFPALPAAAKPQTTIFGYGGGRGGYGNSRGVIRDYGSRETGFSWGSSSAAAAGSSAQAEAESEEGKGKKGKKGKKQVLVQWG